MISNENMKSEYPFKCPCCGEGTIKDFHDICLICGWEDDELQNEDPDYSGGANSESLNEHRNSFQSIRYGDPKYKWCDTWK